MRKGPYILIISILIVGILAFIPIITKPEISDRIHLVSFFFFAIGFLLALLLVMVFLIPFSILPPKNRNPVQNLEQLSSLFIKAQREMKEMNKKLDKELKLKNTRLETMSSELLSTQIELLQKEKLAALAQMASGVVHQIRNPIAIIKNAIYLLKKKTGEDNDLNESIKIVEDEADRMNRIAGELLRFARTGENISLQSVDLKEILQDICKEMAVLQPNYEKVELVDNIPESLSKVKGETESLKQALLNIISNAYQAMPDGGALTLKAHESGENVFLSISDTGTGISPAQKDLVFEPFFTTKDENKGSGLGMAISYAIIKKIGGDIEVYSTEGEGTTFEISLKKGKV